MLTLLAKAKGGNRHEGENLWEKLDTKNDYLRITERDGLICGVIFDAAFLVVKTRQSITVVLKAGTDQRRPVLLYLRRKEGD